MITLPALFTLRGVIHDKRQRDLWYSAELVRAKRSIKGKYAYGSADHKVVETPEGYKLKGALLPKETPIYDYGFKIGERMPVAHGPWVYKHQIPGVTLFGTPSIEEKIFSVKAPVFKGSETIDRSRKKKLRVRCGSGFYRIVLLNVKVKDVCCYIFGTNIRVDTRKYDIPRWMRRPYMVFPHPARTSRNEIKNKFGFSMKIGRPELPGIVKIAGIEMLCKKVGPLCKITFNEKDYYAHRSVVFPIN